jgi:CBS domain-containing protein
MIVCPDCGFDNIPGAEECEECGQSLSALSKPVPASEIEWHIAKDRIELLSPREPVTVSPETPVAQVLKLLVDRRIGCAIVSEQGRMVGIISEHDVLMRLGSETPQHAERPVKEFMTNAPESLGLKDKIAFALHKMDVGGYRHIPIVGETGQPVGIISIRDILRYISERLVKA